METILQKRSNRSHYKSDGTPKKSYKTEKEALLFCFKYNSSVFSIHQSVAYKCSICGNYHIGHTKVELNEEKRFEYEKKYKKFILFH